MSGERILVADDSATIRAIVRAALTTAGHEIVHASDGEEALAVLREHRIDAAVLDIDMPVLDGLGVLREMAQDPALARIPVIFLTGRATAEDVARGLRDGAHDYLRKPVEGSELVARVHGALRTKRLEDELRERNEDLHRLARTDALTGLYNRRAIGEELKRHISLARRHGRPLCIAILDVDEFKRINDALGHDAGDDVLVGIALRVTERVRQDDLFGRWGGEEFLVVSPETDADGGLVLAEAIRAAVADVPLPLAGQSAPVPVTASIGVAQLAEGEDDRGLLRRADEALYAAKAGGRNAVRPATS